MKIKRKVLAGLALPMLMFAQSSFAAGPFTTCPSKAFLIQGSSSVNLYSVDLASGDFKVLNTFNHNGINGLAYNFHDDYLYGWSGPYNDLIRIDSDYNIARMSVSGRPNVYNYVADISPNVNKYFYYHPSHGIHSVSLDPNDANYLKDTLVTSILATGDLKIYDWAVNPNDTPTSTEEYAYTVN